MITYMPAFGPAAYFGNIPSKFVANANTTDGKGNTVLECCLSYSQPWGPMGAAAWADDHRNTLLTYNKTLRL